MLTQTIKAIASVVIVFLVTSCGNSDKIKTIDYYIVGKDSCNLTDENGLRQGKWVPNYNNDLKDTVYYKDGKTVPK